MYTSFFLEWKGQYSIVVTELEDGSRMVDREQIRARSERLFYARQDREGPRMTIDYPLQVWLLEGWPLLSKWLILSNYLKRKEKTA